MGVLDGIRVVDLTRILAGPYATMILADLGAEVVKVERPGRGDETRHWGPPFVTPDGDAAYYAAINRNKRSVALDLKRQRGHDLLLRLLGSADVLASNFSPGVMERLGLGAGDLRARFPRLVYCTISGHPERDPRAHQPSFDLVIQAETGLMHLTGAADGPATKVGISIADELAGLYLVQGLLAALLHRERTGEALPVSIALNEAVLSAFTYQAQTYLLGAGQPARRGNEHPSLVPYRSYRAADADMIVGVASEAQWQRFCVAIGLPGLADDPRFALSRDRVEHRAALEPLLESRLAERDRDHWIEVLRRAQVPCGPVNTVADALEAERGSATGIVVADPEGNEVVGSPLVLGGERPRVRRAAPRLGEHTDEVLRELGLAPEEIATLRADGVVG